MFICYLPIDGSSDDGSIPRETCRILSEHTLPYGWITQTPCAMPTSPRISTLTMSTMSPESHAKLQGVRQNNQQHAVQKQVVPRLYLF